MDDQKDKIDQEILDVISQEKGRGKAPKDPARKREEMKLVRDLGRAMKARNERGFSDALRRGGIREGSLEWKNAWRAYRAYWSF